MLKSLRNFLISQKSYWQTYRRIRDELRQHSNRELFDLRIAPGDIEGIAREGARMACEEARAGA